MPDLTEGEKALLKTLQDMESWGVYADGIVEAGSLVQRGYATCDDDYEGPRLFITEAGRKAITPWEGQHDSD